MTTGSHRPARVLQVVLSLNQGGTERLVCDLTTRLHPSIPMRVCCLDHVGAWAQALTALGITVDALGRQAGFHPSLGVRIAAMARAHGATMIHAHHYSPFVYASIASMLSPGMRLVFTEHGRASDAPPSAKRRLVNRALLSYVPARVFAVSQDLRHYMVQEGFGPAQVEVIYNGIDVRAPSDDDARTRIRLALGVSGDDCVVGTIARLDPVKDLGTLLKAVAIAGTARPMVLVIVGDGPERASLEHLAQTLGLGQRIRFLGLRDDARDWLAGCDLFVNCSVSEGVSLTILEAMAAGLPVIATAVGGTPEVVTEACGALVAPRDPDVLAATMVKVADEPAARRAMGTAARTRVMTHFTLERMVQQYRDVYTGVA